MTPSYPPGPSVEPVNTSAGPPALTRRAAREQAARRRTHRLPSRRPARPWSSRAGRALLVMAMLTPIGWGAGLLLQPDVAVTNLTAASSGGTSSAGGAMAPVPMDSLSAGPTTVSRGVVPSRAPSVATAPRPKTTTRATTPAPRGVRAGEQTLVDLAYASGSEAQKLDLYLPARTGTAVPLVILIHGGAFVGGDKGDDAEQAEALRGKGFAVASLNYRLSGEAQFPAGVRDVKAAVRWLRAHAASHGLHPDRFAAWGTSAGGYLATMLGVTGDQRTTLDDASLGNAKVSSAVQLVVDLYGPGDFLSMDAQAADPGGCADGPQVHDAGDSPESQWLGAPVQSVPALAATSNPMRYLAKAAHLPPFVVAHGNRDCLVPYGQSLQLVAALKKAGASVSFTLVDGAGHSAPEFDGLFGPAMSGLARLARQP